MPMKDKIFFFPLIQRYKHHIYNTALIYENVRDENIRAVTLNPAATT